MKLKVVLEPSDEGGYTVYVPFDEMMGVTPFGALLYPTKRGGVYVHLIVY